MLNLDSIYQEYAELIFRYLFSLCHEEDTAEELMQETFYQAVKSSRKFDGSCKVTTWLCQIAKHLWYQELDRRRRKGTTVLSEEIALSEPSIEEKMCLKEDVIEIFCKEMKRNLGICDKISPMHPKND